MTDIMNLKKQRRTGWTLRGIRDGESLADHCFGVVVLTWFLGRAQTQTMSINVDRAVQLAIMHELAECRVGDIPFPALRYIKEKAAAESAAVTDMMAPLGEAGCEAAASFSEFEAGATLEARFVRAVDKLEMLFTAADYEWSGVRSLADFWDNPATFACFAEFPLVAALGARLKSRRKS